jgi:hypothetical protein
MKVKTWGGSYGRKTNNLPPHTRTHTMIATRSTMFIKGFSIMPRTY